MSGKKKRKNLDKSSLPPSRKPLIDTVSHFEHMSVFSLLTQYLFFQDILTLWICNRAVRKSVLPLSASRAVWPSHRLPLLQEDTRPLVRRVIAEDCENLATNLTYVRFHMSFNQDLVGLPPHLQTIVFGHHFDRPLLPGVLPETLTVLKFSVFSQFDHPFHAGVLPSSLTDLVLAGQYAQPLKKGTLPLLLRHLVLGSAFCHPIEVGVLPPTMISLKFLCSIPDNKIQPGALPLELDSLIFDEDVHQRLDNIIPPNLVHLKLSRFNRYLSKGVLPASLRWLDLGSRFQHPLEPGVLPKGLTTLLLGAYDHAFSAATLPASLTTLQFRAGFSQPLTENMWPLGLLDLTLGDSFAQHIKPDVLPSTLLRLRLGDRFNSSLEPRSLPPSLTYLRFGSSFKQALRRTLLPRTLTKLIFGYRFDNVLKQNVLPPQLQFLSFGHDFNRPLNKKVLPSSLKSLAFGNCFNQPLEQGVLPPRLTELFFGVGFSQHLSAGILPRTLISLHCPNAQIESDALGYKHYISLSAYQGSEEIPSFLFESMLSERGAK